jgi:hypothetical protein
MSDLLRGLFEIGLDIIETYGWWLAALSVFMLMASLLVLRILLVRIPADYFVRHEPLLAGIRHPAWEVLLLVLKNLVGFILVLLGLIMSLPGVAGQGILTVLAGLSLMNFPGKRRLQRLIVMQPLIQKTINGIRARAGMPPLDLDGFHEDAGEGAAR